MVCKESDTTEQLSHFFFRKIIQNCKYEIRQKTLEGAYKMIGAKT